MMIDGGQISTTVLLVSNLMLHHPRWITETVRPPYINPGHIAQLSNNRQWEQQTNREVLTRREENKIIPILINYWQKQKKCWPSKSSGRALPW
jgi:hypothetical protein